jgi:hypothetical protein
MYIRSGQLSQGWTCSLSGLAASLTECKAAATGYRHYITDIIVGTTTSTSGSWAIQSGTGTNCGTATTAMMPSDSTSSRFKAPITSGAMTDIDLATPLAATLSHAICVIGTATNTINIQLVGFTLGP